MTADATAFRRMLNVLTYRGHAGQWAWLLHRGAGLGVLLFLTLHIVDIWVLGLGESAFDRLLILYTWPPFKVLELFLIFGVLYHAVNGLRIILIDFVPGATRLERQLFWLEVVVVLAVMIPAGAVTLASLF